MCAPTAQTAHQQNGLPTGNEGASGPVLQQQTLQQGTDATRGLQSLLSLGPLLPQCVPPVGVLSTTCVPPMVPASFILQQPAFLPPTLLSANPQQQLQENQEIGGLQQAYLPVQEAGSSWKSLLLEQFRHASCRKYT